MANPDGTGSTMNSLVTALPVSILFLLITIFMFQMKDSIPFFNFILWIGLPIIMLLVATGANFVSQYVTCNTTNAGRALLGSLPAGGAILVGLLISSISYCRIPVASVFTPLIVGKSVDITKNTGTTNIATLKNSNSKECCVPKFTLENVESNYPIIAGFSYGFYIMFGTLFGMTIGNGIATIC